MGFGKTACSEFENVIFCLVLHERHILDDLINALNLNGCTAHFFHLSALTLQNAAWLEY
jgi:hypothetical protein